MIKKKQVIIISDYIAEYGGNFIDSLNNLEANLKEHSINVIYVFPNEADTEKWESGYSSSHKVVQCAFSPIGLFGTVRNLMTNDVETIVHMHFLHSKDVIPIKMATWGYKCKLVVHIHMRYPVENKSKNFVKRVVYSGCKKIAVSTAVYDDLVTCFGNKNVYYVRNAISLDRLNIDKVAIFNKRDVIIFGTHFTRKGVDIAIKAMHNSKYKDKIKLCIYTNNESKTIENVKNTGISDWQNYVEVRHVVSNISDVYNKSFCFLSPSRSEAFGYAVVEAAYCNCQVIVSDIPGQNSLRDIPYVNWIKSEDAEDLSNKIDYCYEKSSTEIDKENEAQRKYVQGNYSLNKWSDDIIRIYGL
ncbi:glycosyltransferase family 4 protein [Ligilactobacillus agilis]|uniref:glycosyltransferase family 4 protein n=1 Tax=Ligilactobacillus agilis TaxID=1601 RepID=UPI0014378CB0|nr:glycosyltransferase family 4 protein [Ligilactobacillus agilis]GET15714.1 hypothetical protein NB11A_00050 [Ligilactobacillus agilis]